MFRDSSVSFYDPGDTAADSVSSCRPTQRLYCEICRSDSGTVPCLCFHTKLCGVGASVLGDVCSGMSGLNSVSDGSTILNLFAGHPAAGGIGG